MRSFRVLKDFQTVAHRFRPGTDEQPNIIREDDLAGQVPIEEWLRLKVIEEMPEEKQAEHQVEPAHPVVPRPSVARPVPAGAIRQQGTQQPVDEKKE